MDITDNPDESAAISSRFISATGIPFALPYWIEELSKSSASPQESPYLPCASEH
jgi:hypothetical protein